MLPISLAFPFLRFSDPRKQFSQWIRVTNDALPHAMALQLVRITMSQWTIPDTTYHWSNYSLKGFHYAPWLHLFLVTSDQISPLFGQ